MIAIQIYFVLNKTMIGIFSTKSEVGIYDYADKLLKISLSFITALGTVMLPKIAYIYGSGRLEEVKEYISKSLNFSTFIAIPIMFGLAGISIEFIPWFLSKEFEGSIYVLLILSPCIFFMAWSGVFGTQYLLPLGKMRVYSGSVYAGAVVNLVLNLFLIKPYGAIGASISTLFAELFVMSTQLFFIRHQLELNKILIKTVDYLVAGCIMFFVIRMIGNFLGSTIITTLVQIITGGTTYLLVMLVIEYLKKDGLILNELGKLKLLQNILKHHNQRKKSI